MKILHGREFWGVDKLTSVNFCKLLQTSVNDHWHCTLSNTRFSETHWQTTARDEDIDLESGEYVPVGHIWKFDLEKSKSTQFWGEI